MIVGMVAHLSREHDAFEQALREISGNAAFEIGEHHTNRIPLVLEAADLRRVHDETDWLKDLPGVQHVDVTFVDLAEISETAG